MSFEREPVENSAGVRTSIRKYRGRVLDAIAVGANNLRA